jgi:hypothetical protein
MDRRKPVPVLSSTSKVGPGIVDKGKFCKLRYLFESNITSTKAILKIKQIVGSVTSELTLTVL